MLLKPAIQSDFSSYLIHFFEDKLQSHCVWSLNTCCNSGNHRQNTCSVSLLLQLFRVVYPKLKYQNQSHTSNIAEIEGVVFAQAIQNCYKEIVHWKRNLFKVPSGRAGKSFIRELGRMFQAYADASALESIALQAAMAMPALLQKPHPKSKSKGAHHASRSSIKTMDRW